ncbi:MAG TPA: GFA family protein [Bradyrhizobium sp.]|jgi:hypothetical protein|nr:GFA family protein [Bradyrhizobium sp.]
MQIDGQCHCGYVTFEADIDPQGVSICHCTDCQTLTGSPFRVTVICSGEQVRLTGGMPKVYARTGDNGRKRFQHFCPHCGAPLFTSGEGDQTDDWGIRWGSIRQRDRLKPARQIWCRSAVPWIKDIEELPGRPMD